MALPTISLTLTDRKVAFALLTGSGRKGQRQENEYTVGVFVTKKERKSIIDKLEKFWEENKRPTTKKPKGAFEDFFTESEDEDGVYVFWASQEVSNGITLKRAPGTTFTIDDFEKVGNGSTLDAAYRVFYFNNSHGEGLGLRLSGVSLKTLVPFVGDGASNIEGEVVGSDNVVTEQPGSEELDAVEAVKFAIGSGDGKRIKKAMKALKGVNKKAWKQFKEEMEDDEIPF